MKRKFHLAVSIFILGLSLVAAPVAHASADPGLELHWNFNEGSGTTATDDSGNGNDGTLYNGATYVPGHEGDAVSLDGISQYVEVNNPLTSLGTVNQPYALSAWVNVPSGVTQGNIVHISSNQDGSGWCIPFLRLQNDSFAATGWDSLNGEESAIDTTPVVPGQWYQVMTSWDPTNGLRLFVDGTLVASTPQADYAAAGVPIYVSIGVGAPACSEDQGYLKADVDDVRIYGRALTPSDIQSIATEGDPPTPSSPVPSNTSAIIAAPDTGYGVVSDHKPLVSWLIILALSSLVASVTLAATAAQRKRQPVR